MDDVELLPAPPPPPPPLPPPPSHNKLHLSPIAKGKRTKRQRPLSPVSSSSSEESTTTEEVDTARCLVLLSRGYFSTHEPLRVVNNNNNHPKHTAVSTNKAVGSDGTFVYTCKTCNRSFPSFQALGGHRTSHKKPRNERRAAVDEDDFSSPSTSYRFRLSPLSLQLSNTPPLKIHECSYCGAEFTSGQALGGHMRKHRGGPIVRSPDIVEEGSKKLGKVGLSLDLNFPAPEDDKALYY